MPRYNCADCRMVGPRPWCHGCNSFLTEDVAEAESIMKPLRTAGPIEWATAFGHWGDVFCCVGVMQAHLRATGQDTVKVLYVGPDMSIVEWLEQQPFVSEVFGIKSEKDDYREFWGMTCKPGSDVDDWRPLLRKTVTAVPPADKITQTHINHSWFETIGGLPAQMWTGGVLPDISRMWAQETLARIVPVRTGPLIHLHPVSTWSAGTSEHWAHWLAAIEWLTERTPHTYVLTGLEKIPHLPKSPNLINLTGHTPSNLEVLAISEACDAVISTPNSIAIWAAVQGQKALVVGNNATASLTSYYRRFIQRGAGVTYLNVDTPFSRFQAAACAFLDGGE